MPSTQQQQTQTDGGQVDTQDNAAKMKAVNDLLGLTEPEQAAEPEKGTQDTESEETTLSEALAEAEKPTDSEGESRDTVKPPKTLKELAERTGFKVEDLYAIEIPAAEDGGESMTVGSLKDLAASESDFAGRELELQERRVKFGNDQAKARAELEIVLNSLPEGAIKPEVLERARKERELMLDREAARTLDVIPEWGDDKAKRADLAGMGEHLEQYGFDKGHIEQIADHRMLRYMRDNWNRKTLVEKALERVNTVKTPPKSKRKQPAAKKAAPTATPDSSMQEKLSAIDHILSKG